MFKLLMTEVQNIFIIMSLKIGNIVESLEQRTIWGWISIFNALVDIYEIGNWLDLSIFWHHDTPPGGVFLRK